MYEIINIANYVYSLAMDKTNNLTKSIMQCELWTLIKSLFDYLSNKIGKRITKKIKAIS